MNNKRTKAYLMLILVALIWGSAGPVIKYTLGGISTLNFLIYRFTLSSLVAIVSSKFLKVRLFPTRKNLFLGLIYGFLTSTVALGFLFMGLAKTTVLDMTLIAITAPLLITVAGVIFLKDHITKREKIGIGIAFAGSSLAVIQPLVQNGESLSQLSGNIFVILYLLTNTVSVVLIKKLLRRGVSPLTLTNTSFIVGLVSLIPISILINNNFYFALTTLPLTYHLGVIFMALISGNLAYTLWTRGQKTIEVSEASLFTYLQPIFSAPLAVFWLGEKISLVLIFGFILIALGVFIAEFKHNRKVVD